MNRISLNVGRIILAALLIILVFWVPQLALIIMALVIAGWLIAPIVTPRYYVWQANRRARVAANQAAVANGTAPMMTPVSPFRAVVGGIIGALVGIVLSMVVFVIATLFTTTGAYHAAAASAASFPNVYWIAIGLINVAIFALCVVAGIAKARK